MVDSGVTEAPDAQDMGDILRRLGAPVLGVVFTGEELSASQRKVLDAGMAASGRNLSALDVAAVEESDPLDEPDVDDEAGTEATPELHRS